MTDKEIAKGKALLKKLEEAYNAYYDTSKGMPYDIDTTIRESAICIESALKEIERQKDEPRSLQRQLKNSKLHEAESVKALKNERGYRNHDEHMMAVETLQGFVAFLKRKATTRFDWNDAVDVGDLDELMREFIRGEAE